MPKLLRLRFLHFFLRFDHLPLFQASFDRKTFFNQFFSLSHSKIANQIFAAVPMAVSLLRNSNKLKSAS